MCGRDVADAVRKRDSVVLRTTRVALLLWSSALLAELYGVRLFVFSQMLVCKHAGKVRQKSDCYI